MFVTILVYFISLVSSVWRTFVPIVSAYSIAGCRAGYLRQTQRYENGNPWMKKEKRANWGKFSVKIWCRKLLTNTRLLLIKYFDFILVSILATCVLGFMNIGILGYIGLVLLVLSSLVQGVNAESTSDEESTNNNSSSENPSARKSDSSQEPNKSKNRKRLRFRHHGYLNNVADPNQM
jgi:Na+-transporting methylmalonyl-CoA/oxaloacetate decarboxylase gamma subunit